MVIGTVSVTALAYLDTSRRIDEKQDQIDGINAKISAQDKTIESLAASVSTLAGSIGAIEVRIFLIFWELAIKVFPKHTKGSGI